ncbi:MAG TPA: hypothetical protein VLG27_03455 [Candidatus Saccharimonadia bacterium]|nr:hypothetical protein [Candidatus Saccharimonadia bacterium]
MSRRLFYRNVNARDHLELFLVSAVSSLLLLRFYLHAAGYPQVGGGSLHIAHMLWGGLLMLAAIVINLSFLGMRVQRFCAFIGGIGFGIFIDELGKFLTKDNNYFFRPTIGLIYAIFAILYLVGNFISRDQRLSSEEYQLNALQQMEEAVRKDMDAREKGELKRLLARADQDDAVTKELQAALSRLKTVRHAPSRLDRFKTSVGRAYDLFWQQRRSNQLVAGVFLLEALIFLGVVVGNISHSFASVHDLLNNTDTYSTRLLIGQLASSVVASVFAIIGAVKLTSSRLEGFEWFRRALLINLFLTEFFIFSRVQFQALPGFVINLLMLIVLRAAIAQERHSRKA